MKKLLSAIIIISLVRVFAINFCYKNVYVEENKTIYGKIVYVKEDEDKITFDVKVKEKYRITVYDKFNYGLGDLVKVTGKFYTPSNNTVFNLFNYRKYLLSKNVNLICNAPKIKLISNNKNVLYHVKNKILKHISKYKTKAYLKAFVLGDTSDIRKEVKKSYQFMGISHLLSISGMHVNVFIIFINLLLKKFKYKNFIIILFLLFFLFLTGFLESLMRCTLFLLLNMINKRLRLNIKSTYLLILTASILLLYNPYLIYSVGFLFSVIITFFILLSDKYLKDNKNYLLKVFVLSIISFLASIPILSSNFFKINLLSVIYNIIFVPFVSFIIFPLSLITFIFPFLDKFYLMFIKVFEILIIFLSKINILNFVISKPSFIVLIMYYLILYLSLRLNKKIIIVFVIMLIININSRFLISKPEITFLDVGQGDSCVIILPKGKVIVIDTGGKAFGKSNIPEDKIIPYLNSRGINKIELLILTHADYDHAGDALKLINGIKVKQTLINKGIIDDLEKKVLNKTGASIIKDDYQVDNYVFYFLNNKVYDNENDNSIIIYFSFYNKNILLMGDASKKVEKDLINTYNLPKMDILKIGHHGSKTSSSTNFINLINPFYSIISVGKNNRYGHPNKEVLEKLKNSKILRTDEFGSIRFVFGKNVVNKYTSIPYIIVER